MTELSGRPLLIEKSSVARAFLPAQRTNVREIVSEDRSAANIGVRGYVITGGRATSDLAYETMLSRSTMQPSAMVHNERAAIMNHCQKAAMSVAELSAFLRLPIGVVRVLASDLVREGFLIAHRGGSERMNDVSLISTLIAGVRAL
jgi:Protein of unknown function (DUF742)